MTCPADPNTAARLKSAIEHLIRLRDDRHAITVEIREFLKIMKDDGFDVPTINAVVKRAEMEPAAVIEADALLETYEAAIGTGAAAAGILSTKMNADGSFSIAMTSAAPAAEPKLTKATQARRSAMALAEMAKRARGE